MPVWLTRLLLAHEQHFPEGMITHYAMNSSSIFA